ncbi:TPA: transketolase [archaeon]|uniref:Transketolase n=1 Tax=Candidatus Naiadarchaeum limnaeum TaxID=2756139 RepID=A0A832V3Y5_9ARCH|nr:transketolase [Candidatus Naiadarchaeum limnaeum]
MNKLELKAKETDIEFLQKKAKQLRRDIVEMLYRAQSGHPGGSLSETDILVALYYTGRLNISPKNYKDPNRDRFILSKGHACPALYAILADLGFFSKSELNKFRKIGALLQGHAVTDVPGIEFSVGTLGQGLSFANGIALARKLDGKNFKIFVLLGDGETQEGQIWEAAMSAANYNLDVVAIVDRNKIQNDEFVDKTKRMDPYAEKWKSFGWKVIECNGHDFNSLATALDNAENLSGPRVIIADTSKGKGVSFMELNPEFHGKAPNEEEYKKAIEELK